MTSGATEAAPTAVTVWGENRHEKLEPDVAQRYPKGMHETIALGILRLAATAVTVRTVTLDDPEHGLTYDLLDRTDVLVWCGHAAHADVSDEVVERCMSRSSPAWAWCPDPLRVGAMPVVNSTSFLRVRPAVARCP
jgi:trehalose utilization protein